MDEIMNVLFDHRYIILAFVTSIVGTNARIHYEKDQKVVSKRTTKGYYSASVFVSMLFYFVLSYMDKIKLIPLACLVGGLISVNIIEKLIEVGPKWFTDFFERRTGLKNNDNEE